MRVVKRHQGVAIYGASGQVPVISESDAVKLKPLGELRKRESDSPGR